MTELTVDDPNRSLTSECKEGFMFQCFCIPLSIATQKTLGVSVIVLVSLSCVQDLKVCIDMTRVVFRTK